MTDEIKPYTLEELDTGVSIVPGVSILGVLSNLNYQPWYALGEYVDNAIQSAERSLITLRRIDPNYQLHVEITYDEYDGGKITITDNAGGIARRDFNRAFKAAEAPPDRSGLSEFGMGMKSASIWFANNWKVTTTSVGDPNIYTVEFDMESVLQNKVERLEVVETDGARDDHYTRIELWNLNQFLRSRTSGKVKDHLREIYRVFLRDKRLVLTYRGEQLKYIEPEVLRAPDCRGEQTDISHEWRKDVDFGLNGGVHVSGWAALRSEGKTSGNGLSLFRRGRVIVGTGDTPYRPERIFGAGNSYRSQRLFGELTIEGLPVSHTKDGFQWKGLEEDFLETLRAQLDSEPLPLLKQAERYRARQATRSELRRIREATANTASVAKRAIPTVMDRVVEKTYINDTLQPSVGAADQFAQDIAQTFSFPYDDRTWTVSITAAYRPSEKSWLVRNVDVEQGTGNVTAQLLLNTGHPFLKQFALGNSDALEAVFRLAVALVVSESLSNAAGDGESTARFMRQVDTLLGEALSKRVRDVT